MFEPEDSATEEQEKPSEAGFYAIILSKVIDEVSILQYLSQNSIISFQPLTLNTVINE